MSRRDWRAAVALACDQHGVIALGQLIALGFSASGVRSLVAAGRLHRTHRGVFALSPLPLSLTGSCAAAVLACGPRSLTAHVSAGALHGLVRAGALVDVCTPRRVRRAGIRTHRLPVLEPADRCEVDGVPCTSVARTLLDLAASRPALLGGALAQAETLRVFDLRALNRVMAANESRPGTARLRAALRALAEHPDLRSEFERRFMPIAVSAGLPAPLTNHRLSLPGGAIEVDLLWPDLRLVVELDGYRYHRGPDSFVTDRRRDRRLAAAGYICLRFTWRDLDDPARVRAELRAVALRRFRPR